MSEEREGGDQGDLRITSFDRGPYIRCICIGYMHLCQSWVIHNLDMHIVVSAQMKAMDVEMRSCCYRILLYLFATKDEQVKHMLR